MITLNGTDFTTCIFKLSSVFFSICFFIMIMNRLHCQGRMFNCAALEQSLDSPPPLLTVEANTTLLVMKIIGIVKGLLLFVYIHNKNKYLRFCKLSLKNRIQLSVIWFPFAQHKNELKLRIGYLYTVFLSFS